MILFIDIDGVVQPLQSYTVFWSAEKALLEAKRRGWRLILSSSWRCGLLDEAYKLFDSMGTPLDGHCPPEVDSKTNAMIAWLIDEYGDEWPEAIAVDDWPLRPVPGIRMIQVDGMKGLTPADLFKD